MNETNLILTFYYEYKCDSNSIIAVCNLFKVRITVALIFIINSSSGFNEIWYEDHLKPYTQCKISFIPENCLGPR